MPKQWSDQLPSARSDRTSGDWQPERVASPSSDRQPEGCATRRIFEVHGSGDLAKTYTLSDLSGRRSGLGFTQPVAAERLTPVELLPLAREDDDSLTSMIYNDGGRDRPAKVKAQSLDGKVYIEFDDEPGKEICVDLSKSKYRWC